jgi:hypothetical protein
MQEKMRKKHTVKKHTAKKRTAKKYKAMKNGAEQASKLVSLAPEIIDQIAASIEEIEDFCFLRLTCKELEAKTRYRFAKVYFNAVGSVLSTQSLQRLIDIVQHPFFGKFINIFYFEHGGLCSYEEQIEELREQEDGEVEHADLITALDEERFMYRSGGYTTMLVTAFRALGRSVAILLDHFIYTCPSSRFSKLVGHVIENTDANWQYSIERHNAFNDEAGRMFQTILTAIAETQLPICTLAISPSHDDDDALWMGSFRFPKPFLLKLKPILNNLTCLRLDLWFEEWEDEESVWTFTKQCTVLTHFELEIHAGENWHHLNNALFDLANSSWQPPLRVLKLYGPGYNEAVHSDNIWSFIMQFADTLSCLCLASFGIQQCHLPTWFRALLVKLPKLTFLRIMQLIEWDRLGHDVSKDFHNEKCNAQEVYKFLSRIPLTRDEFGELVKGESESEGEDENNSTTYETFMGQIEAGTPAKQATRPTLTQCRSCKN